MSGTVTFTLDGRAVSAAPGESIFAVAKREGIAIPHLCHADREGYRADGNCRACMVEIAGERVLAASCIRQPAEGMVVTTTSARAEAARRTVFELLAAEMPGREAAPDPDAPFWRWSAAVTARAGHIPPAGARVASPHDAGLALHDASHLAIAVNLDACIACGLCVRACREVQVNDVIGMGFRGAASRPVFDLADPMGQSTCVSCGECVEVCPTGALYEKALMDGAARRRAVVPDRVIDTLCPYCGVGCQTAVAVKGGRIVQVDGRNGPANQGRLCVKGRFGFDYIHHPHRLTQPLIRREDAPKRGEAVVDPANPWDTFRPATWEEALARAATGLTAVYQAKGGAGIAGFGSAKGSNEEAFLFQKLIRQAFGTNNVDHCTRLCHASSVAALMEGIGSGAVSAPFRAVEQADCILVIGSRATENHPVAATYFKQAARRGAKLIVLDPRGNPLFRHATHPVRFTPGADVALLNAMLHVIITEGLVNRAYIAAHVEGFDALEERIGAFTPEAMAPVCGVAPATIREIARLYATSARSIIFWGMGVSQHVHGTDNARCLIALSLITGQIGREGTGLHPLRGQNNVQGASDAGLIPMFYPDYHPVIAPENRAAYEAAWGRPLDPAKGLTVVEIMHAIHAGSIEAMLIMGENPAMSDPDQAHARAALARLKHLVVQDIFLTETAWHADVVLPASAHAEKLGTFTNTNRQVQIGRPAVEPPGEARRDLDILIDLARALGLNWSYGSVADVYEEMRSLMPSLAGLPWARIEREGAVTYPADDAAHAGHDVLFADHFPRAGGKGKIVPADVLAPDEVPDAAYPLVLTTGRLLEHWHTGSMTRRAGVLDAMEPDGIATLHPEEIRRAGRSAGERAVIETRRGRIEAVLRADAAMPEGMVFVPFAFNEAAANRLTNPALDPYGKIPELKFCAARLVAG